MESEIKVIDPFDENNDYLPLNGEVVQSPNGDYYVFANGEYNRIPTDMTATGPTLSLYELNKQIISQLPTIENLIDKAMLVKQFHKKYNNRFYMLYGKEISYFTLFEIFDAHRFGIEVVNCINDLGPVKDISLTENKDAIEIWLMYEDEATCLYLFPYDNGLIKVGV